MDVLERFATGDLDAFESLFRQYQRDVYGWILRIVRNPAAAEELTVETFWRLYRSRARLDPTGNCAGWLRRVATNAAIDHLRRARPVEPLESDPPDRTRPDCVEQQELRAAIRGALDALPPKLRVVVRLALIEDEPYWSIAQALGISESAVKLRIFRARRILQKHLQQRGVTP